MPSKRQTEPVEITVYAIKELIKKDLNRFFLHCCQPRYPTINLNINKEPFVIKIRDEVDNIANIEQELLKICKIHQNINSKLTFHEHRSYIKLQFNLI